MPPIFLYFSWSSLAFFLLPALSGAALLIIWVRLVNRRIAVARARAALSAAGANSDGEELDQKLSEVEAALDAFKNEIGAEARRDILDRLKGDFEKGRAQLAKEAELFKKEFQSIHDHRGAQSFLNREQNRITQEFSVSTAQARRRLEELKKLRKLRAAVRPRLKALQSLEKPSYVVLRKGEELSTERDDARLVRVVKWMRRALIPVERLWVPLIRPLWPKEARRSFQLSSEKRVVPLDRILKGRVQTELQPFLEKRFLKVEKALSDAGEDLDETLRVLHFNLDSAAAMAEEAETGQKDISLASLEKAALDCLERVKNRLDDIVERTEKAVSQLEKDFSADARLVERHIRRDCDVADTFGRKVAEALEAVQNSSKEVKKWAAERYPQWKRTTEAWVRWGQGRISKAQSRLGFEKASRADTLALLEDINYQRVLQKFPPLYRRLFRLDPLSDGQFLVGREREMAQMKTAFDKWSDGKSVSAAVYGRNGNGKTSFLKCAFQKFVPDQRVFWIDPSVSFSSGEDVMKFIAEKFGLPFSSDRDDSTLALADSINKELNPAIVVMEGAHFLFERRVGGFESLREFLTLMALTRPRIMWVLSFNEASWTYLDRAVHLSKYFTSLIPVRGLSRKDMAAAILQRHDMAGFNLEADFSSASSHEMKKKAARIEDHDARVEFALSSLFDALYETTEGNIVSSFYGWLNNLKPSEEEGFIIKPPFRFFPALSGYLSPNETHAVLAILEQGAMDKSHLGKIMRLNERESRLTLKALADSRILNYSDPSNETGFQVNTVLLPELYRVFKEKNLLLEEASSKP